MTTIFLHIPKTGGTTICDLLRRSVPRSQRFDHIRYRDRRMGDERAFRRASSGVECVLGHYSYGIHERFDPPARYFTMLREPVERVLSMYSFHQGKLFGRYLRNVSLAEFLDRHGPANNGQTRILTGRGKTPSLDEATDNLMSCTAFGLTEAFDDSLELFRDRGLLQSTDYRKRNVTRKRVRREDISAAQLREIEERNAIDIALYDAAVRAFAQQRPATTA